MNPEYVNVTPQEVVKKRRNGSVKLRSDLPLTADRLREMLRYDEGTGLFTWLVSRYRTRAGDTAGSVLNTGYVRIVIDGKKFFAHRLAFLYVEGKFPEFSVDHIDGVPANNRWANLRKATHSENLRNQYIKSNNTSGVKGVSWYRKSKKWKAQIVSNGRVINLGHFETMEEAAEAYRKAGRELHGEFFNDGTKNKEAA